MSRFDRLPEFPPSLIPRSDDLPQADGLTGQLLADGAAEKGVPVIDPDFGEVPGVVADGDRFTDIGRQYRIDVAEPLEADAILLDPARFEHCEEEQVELFQRLRHPRQETVTVPA